MGVIFSNFFTRSQLLKARNQDLVDEIEELIADMIEDNYAQRLNSLEVLQTMQAILTYLTLMERTVLR